MITQSDLYQFDNTAKGQHSKSGHTTLPQNQFLLQNVEIVFQVLVWLFGTVVPLKWIALKIL